MSCIGQVAVGPLCLFFFIEIREHFFFWFRGVSSYVSIKPFYVLYKEYCLTILWKYLNLNQLPLIRNKVSMKARGGFSLFGVGADVQNVLWKQVCQITSDVANIRLT